VSVVLFGVQRARSCWLIVCAAVRARARCRDKAGGYGIQAQAASFVGRINGCEASLFLPADVVSLSCVRVAAVITM
jgi:hypothetical protein